MLDRITLRFRIKVRFSDAFTCITERIIQIQRIQKTFSSPYLYLISSDGYVVKLLRCRHSGFCLRVPGSVLKPSTFFTSGYVYISVHIIICIVITQFGSACECNSLALKLTKENTKNVKFEDPSLMFSIVWDARDQTGPGSLSLRRETLGTRLHKALFMICFTPESVGGRSLHYQCVLSGHGFPVEVVCVALFCF